MSWIDRLLGRTPPQPATTLQEGILAQGYDPDLNLTAAQGGSAYYRKLTTSNRDLSPLQHDRMLEIAYYLYDANPLAKRILELTRDYILGEGVEIRATDKAQKLQPILDRHWQDHINRWDLKLHDKVLELGLFGEQCYTVSVNPVDGHVRLGYVDPGRVGEVLRDPHNAEVVQAIALKSESGGAVERLKVIQVDERPGSRSFGRLIGAETDQQGQVIETWRDGDVDRPYLGSCFWFAINKVSTAQRGRSDLLGLADWVDGYDQLLFGELDRTLLIKSFLYDVSLAGADEAAVAAAKLRYAKPPNPGSILVHNDRETWQVLTPDLKAQDAQNSADLILSTIATGSGHPKTWLNGMMDDNRASAEGMGEPAFKRLAERQRYVSYMLDLIMTYVLDQAELHGQVKYRGAKRPEPWPVTISLPEMRPANLVEGAQTLFQATQALAVLKAEGAIDTQVEQEAAVLLLGLLGLEVDADEMRGRIEQEAAANAEKQAALFGPAVPAEQPDEESETFGQPNGRANGALAAAG